MATWILILTMYDHKQNNGPAVTSSIESINGFKTERACLYAGSAWLKQNNINYVKALCVRSE